MSEPSAGSTPNAMSKLLARIPPAHRRDLAAVIFYALPVGVLVGSTIAAYDYIINGAMWGTLEARLPTSLLLFMPCLGMVLAGLLLRLSRQPNAAMADEVVAAYHGDPHTLDKVWGKCLASIATMGFGASAGMEGASKWLGAVVAGRLHSSLNRLPSYRRLHCPWRLIMLSGASAAIAAIFRAPLTGTIMGVESPFRKDLAHEALVTSLVSSAVSFAVFRSLRDGTPYFTLPFTYHLAWSDVLGAIPLGVAAGLASHAFLAALRYVKQGHQRTGFPHMGWYVGGGLALSALGFICVSVLGEAVSLQSGLPLARSLLASPWPWGILLFIFAVKFAATVITFGCGGVGGLFVPSATIGAALGALCDLLLAPSVPGLYAFLGIAAFTGASYNSLLFACVFIAETTGNSAMLVPGIVASVVAYLVSLGVSNSSAQKWERMPLDPT